ncbi:MAG TPA: sigma-70 family RNA polymerase sigma factor [Phycisphaerae bacterium]|nr:sigma-70 family RNA polymerase sigma factor [Phycisphaerae bacterium]
MEPIFDAAWHAKALAGDAEAVRLLARTAITPLYRFCFYRVGQNLHLCEDVVQETMVHAIGDLSRYDPKRSGGSIFPWLSGLARNEIRRVLSKHRSAVSLEALWAKMDKELLAVYARLESEPFADEVLRRDETRSMVNAAMSQLPPRYGAALEAKYILGQSIRDIAGAWRISEKAVESLLSRAREAFRATFVSLAKNMTLEVESVGTARDG